MTEAVAKALEALEKAERRLHGAWQMLEAINENDPSRDRKAAAERALDGLNEVRDAIASLRAADAGVPAGWKLVEDFSVGARVIFEGVEHVIFALGDRPGTFDIRLPTGRGDRWRNVPPSALKYANSDDARAISASPAAPAPQPAKPAQAPHPITPTYYVRHPDGSHSVADPQPTPAPHPKEAS